jgi:hypothetical protein
MHLRAFQFVAGGMTIILQLKTGAPFGKLNDVVAMFRRTTGAHVRWNVEPRRSQAFQHRPTVSDLILAPRNLYQLVTFSVYQRLYLLVRSLCTMRRRPIQYGFWKG